MKTRVPAFYKDFHCIGSACRDNCCIGWEIDIDDRSAAFYREVSGPFGERLKKKIDWEQQCFRLTEGERCPFLNEQNLCDIIIEFGEEHLCDICDRHPRFRNVLSDHTEMGIGLCCEEAVRLLLSCDEKMSLVPGPDIADEPVEDSTLTDSCSRIRGLAFSVLQNREIPLNERVKLLLSLADDLYRCQDNIEEYSDICTRYAEIPLLQPENVEKQEAWKDISEILLSLERLDESWTPLMEHLSDPVEDKELPEIPFEQLIWYFLFRHVMTAAEDGDIAGRLMFAAVSFLVIRRLVRQGGDLADIVRRYSKEIEYSTENMEILYDSFAWEDVFRGEVLTALV